MKSLSHSLVAGLAVTVCAPFLVQAQCGADSSQTLTGKYTYSLSNPIREAGQFTVIPGAPGTGRASLQVVSSVVTGGFVTRYDNGSGSLLYNANCSGGVGWFYGAFGPISFDFEFQNDTTFGRIIVFRNPQFPAFVTGTDYPNLCITLSDGSIRCNPLPWPADAPPGTAVANTIANAQWGTAWRAPAGCPATPSSLFTGAFTRLSSIQGVTRLDGTATTNTGGTFVGVTPLPGFAGVPSAFTPPATPVPTPPGFAPVTPPALLTVPGVFETASDCVRNCIFIYAPPPQAYAYDAYPRVALNGTVSFVALGWTLNNTSAFNTTLGTIAR